MAVPNYATRLSSLDSGLPNHTAGFVRPCIPSHTLPYDSDNMFPPPMLPFSASNSVLNPNGIATKPSGCNSVTQTNKQKRTTASMYTDR